MNWQSFKNIFGRLAIALLVLFALYSNVLLVIRNQNLNDRLKSIEGDLAARQERNQKLNLLLYYYQSQSYQDSEARSKLNLKKPDETVLAVSGLKTSSEKPVLQEDVYGTAQVAPPSSDPNIVKWWKYLFGS